MDRKEIIDGLKMTMELCVLDPSTGEEIEPHLLNDISKATYDACKGALEILERLDTDSDTISRQAAIDAVRKSYDAILDFESDGHTVADSFEDIINALPSAQPEIKPIDYQDCANAMLRMWMDEVVTDGEYNRIMDKLNAFWRTRNEQSD